MKTPAEIATEVARELRAWTWTHHPHGYFEHSRATIAKVIQDERDRPDKVEQQLEWMKAAHLLLANEHAFIAPKGGSPFFVMAEISGDDTPMLSLNMSDTFYYACADAEPFRYEDAPEMLRIARQAGWPGLVAWAAEQRKARGEHHEPITPVEEMMAVTDRAAAELKSLKEGMREISKHHHLSVRGRELILALLEPKP